MAKKRVYEAAKELGIPAKELISRLQEVGLEKKSNFSTLEDDEIDVIAELFDAEGSTPSEAPAAEQEAARAVPPAPRAETATATEPAPQTAPAGSAPKATNGARPQGTLARPPIVTVLGHVDHGKTTLLDTIRKAKVAAGEAGGITQSIGAYRVDHNGRLITFIDTPGHAAFTQMRARGAKVTDIVVLVVAADDGVMAQTEEAINHATAAGVPIIVAINKVDKAPTRVDRVKEQLGQHDLLPEDWGGSTITVPISALEGDGIDELLEMIHLTAEMQELHADPGGELNAVVIESHLDPQMGPVAAVVVKNGTLRNRDVVVVGNGWGRVRALIGEDGGRLEEAGPGTPVQILGLDKVPAAGATLQAVAKASEAKKLVQKRMDDERQQRMAPQRKNMADLMSQMLEQGKLRLVLKADSAGCLEAMEGELGKIELPDVSIEVLHTGIGPISESDVMLAASDDENEAAVIGFRTTVDKGVAEAAQRSGVTLRTYQIIYDLTQDVERALKRMIEPEYQDVKVGELEVRNTFPIHKVGTVAGCFVRDGLVTRNTTVRVYRDGVELHHGPIKSLKRFEQDARQVEKGKECGILLEKFNDIEKGDVFEVYKTERVEP